jgi:hypothetical protein
VNDELEGSGRKDHVPVGVCLSTIAGTAQNEENPRPLCEFFGPGIEKYFVQIPNLSLHFQTPVYNT